MMSPGGQPAYPNPVPAPSAAFDKKVRLLGNVALALAILKLLVFGYRILRSLATLVGLDDAPRHQVSRAITRGLDGYRRTVAIGDGLRAIPFIVVGVLLVLIALRLQRGDVSALDALRTWFFWSLGAVAISIVIQAVVIIPATLTWEVAAANTLPSIPFFDMKGMVNAVAVGSLLFGVLFGTLLRLVIPVVLYVWAGQLQAERKKAALQLAAPRP